MWPWIFRVYNHLQGTRYLKYNIKLICQVNKSTAFLAFYAKTSIIEDSTLTAAGYHNDLFHSSFVSSVPLFSQWNPYYIMNPYYYYYGKKGFYSGMRGVWLPYAFRRTPSLVEATGANSSGAGTVVASACMAIGCTRYTLNLRCLYTRRRSQLSTFCNLCDHLRKRYGSKPHAGGWFAIFKADWVCLRSIWLHHLCNRGDYSVFGTVTQQKLGGWYVNTSVIMYCPMEGHQ